MGVDGSVSSEVSRGRTCRPACSASGRGITHPMSRLPLLVSSLMLAWFAVLAPAQAAPVIGIGDQNAPMFTSPFFQQLDVQVSRIIISYDAVLLGTPEVNAVDAWMAAARRAGVKPLVALNASRGCFDGVGVVKSSACRLPSVKRYRRAFRAFRTRYPDVADVSPWNEANHRSQPTDLRPDRAADYYRVARADCRGCTIVAADILDEPGMVTWMKGFRAALRRAGTPTPRLWGLHNYQDVNNGTTSGTRRMLRIVPGTIWVTETGGIVNLGKHRPFSPTRAAKATSFMFALAKSSPRIKRLYIYNWTGAPRQARFDAGLVDFRGKPRPAFYVVKKVLRRKGGNPKPAEATPAPPPPAPQPPPPPPPSSGDAPAQPPPPSACSGMLVAGVCVP
jgi:hypothetical protein